MSTPLFKHAHEQVADTIAQRFMSKIATSNECWTWTGTRDADGYGVIKIQGRMHKAHRIAFRLAFGWIPTNGSYICHKCDNRSCVNPAHLFAGLPRDNSFDMVSKGRSAKGERVGTAKLTETQVREILSRLAHGETKKALAREYGVSDTLIRFIATGKTWRHISQEVA